MPFAETNSKHVSLASLFVFDWLNLIPVPRVLRNKTELQTDCPFLEAHRNCIYKHIHVYHHTIWCTSGTMHTQTVVARDTCAPDVNRLPKRTPFGSGRTYGNQKLLHSVYVYRSYTYTMQRVCVKLYIGKLHKEKQW